MKKVYQYLFYKLYSYMLRTPNKTNAFDGAVALISIIGIFVLMDILVIVGKLIFNINHVSMNIMIVPWLIIMFFIYLINNMYFKKYIILIKERFDNESNTQKWVGRIIVFIVGFGSVGSLILIGLLLK